MNDLAAFDLNQLQMANNRWEILIKSEASPQIPAARTNHTIVTYNDKMYLFGGTNGFQWFNDVWCYDPALNKWEQLDCIGYIPAPREGHAAAIVDDVMYIFGGRTEEGTDLGDLAAFRISLRRWYTFQNMGPSPSPRSGHSMTTVGKSIVVLGGEPSSTTNTTNDLGILYVLDTTKIRYPVDGQQTAARNPQASRPSLDGVKTQSPGESPSAVNEPRRLMSSPTPSGNPASNLSPSGLRQVSDNMTNLAAVNGLRGPAGPPPQGPTPAKPTDAPPAAPVISPAASPQIGSNQSPVLQQGVADPEEAAIVAASAAVNGVRSPPQASAPTKMDGITKHARVASGDVGDATRSAPTAAAAAAAVAPARPASPPAPTRQLSNSANRRSSGRNSQTVALLKELDNARNKNAWYASELELARKSGYSPPAGSSPALDAKSAQTFDDEDRPLIEALLTMRTELANVQSAVDKQAVVAARQIAEAEKQRDAAIQEALYAKAKYAAHTGGSASSTPNLDADRDELGRSDEVNKKLAAALHLQKDLQARLDTMKTELAAEKKARQLADETSAAAEKRMTDLESYKQNTSAEVASLKADLHLSQREAREHSSRSSEAVAALALLKVEKDDLHNKYKDATGGAEEHKSTFETLHLALKSSDEAKTHLEGKLSEERAARELAETNLAKLKAEHDARGVELSTSAQRARDAEELAQKHAEEARTHRLAVLSGLDKINSRDLSRSGGGDAERVIALQAQVTAANALAKKYQTELDGAADKLRSAEERIAGLEQYQEQSSREGVSIRRQLQAALRETQGLQAAHSEVKNQLAAQQLETNAMTVQHTALKDILAERGISPTGVRSRGLSGSPRTASPEQTRMKDLESQLANAHAAHEETKKSFSSQAQESESAYREKLTQLESDYQSAVHYVKGTEKMLKQLKEQLTRYKNDNTRLKNEVDELEKANGHGLAASSQQWETERSALQTKVDTLQAELKTSGAALEKKLESLKSELTESNRQREAVVKEHATTSTKLQTQVKDLEHLRSENSLLEQRAADAEQKVALLLDQVENSVDNYRRRSRIVPGDFEAAANGGGHSRKKSIDAESFNSNGIDNRNSMALDSLANELETLRSHWEATNKNYRLSTSFDLDVDGKKDGGVATSGLSESLADWRKKLDAEENAEKK